MSEDVQHNRDASERVGRRGKALIAALGVSLSLGACQSTREVAPVEPAYGGPPIEEEAVDLGPTPEKVDMAQDMDSQEAIAVPPAPVYGGPPVDDEPLHEPLPPHKDEP